LRGKGKPTKRIILDRKIHFDAPVQNPEFHAPAFVRFWSNSGHWLKLARDGMVAKDPKATCGDRTAGRSLLRHY
jgi:hypothetical protein